MCRCDEQWQMPWLRHMRCGIMMISSFLTRKFSRGKIGLLGENKERKEARRMPRIWPVPTA